MAGKRGMKMPSKKETVRKQIWRSMRIMIKFTITGLIRTIPDGTTVSYANVQKFIRQLVTHGYVVKEGNYTGGRSGTAQQYRLVNNIGPTPPLLGIGRSQKFLSNKCEKPDENRETETDTQTQGGAP